MRRADAIPPALALLMLVCVACDDSNSSSDDQTGGKGEALQLVVPPHGSTPRVNLTFRVQPLEESDIETVKEPIGNAFYLALRACDGAHPPEGAANVVPVEFDVEKGRVKNVSKREPKVRGDAEPVDASERSCVYDNLRDSDIEFSGERGLGERMLRVDAQAKLYWEEDSK